MSQDIPEGFKITEIGLMPEEWELSQLGDVVNTYSGGTPRRDTPEYWHGDIGWLKSGELNDSIILSTDEKITEEGLNNSSTRFVDKGTLLIALYGATAGKVGLAEARFTINQAICAIIPSDVFNSKFYFYYLQMIRNKLLAERFGGAQPNLNQQIIRSIIIPLPPLPEQRAIASILSVIQEAKQRTEAVIQATRELKKSLMKHLFSYGVVPLDEAENVPLKETKIGMVPEDWDVVKLEDLTDISYGIQAAVANNTDSSIGVPILTNINITINGKIDLSTLRYYNLSDKKNGERYILSNGDVLFNWRSGSKEHVGKTAYYNLGIGMTHSSFILRIRSLDNNMLNSKYIFYYLTFIKQIVKYFEKFHDYMINAKFNASHTKQLPMVVPPLPIQQQIADILTAVDQKIEAEEGRSKALDELFKTLLSNLMTGRIRVNNMEIS